MAIADQIAKSVDERSGDGSSSVGVRARQCTAVLAVFVSMQPFVGGPLGQVIRLAVFVSAGAAICIVGIRARRTIRMMKDMHLRAVFVIPLASLAWSVNRQATETELLSFIGATAIAVLIVQELSYDRAIAAVMVAAGAALILSIGAELVVPALRAGESFGTSGIFEHKNTLGRATILLSMAVLIGWASRGRTRVWLTGALLSFAAIFGFWIGSGTSTVTVAVTIVAFIAMIVGRIGPFRDARIRQAGGWAAMVIIVGLVSLVGSDDLLRSTLGLLGREADNNTLFVRLSLWEATIDEIVERPVLGFGYGTFDFQSVTVSTGLRTVVWEAQQPHNGLLHVAYQLGVVGLVVYARHLFALWRSVSRVSRRNAVSPYLLLLGLANITYSMLYGTLAVFWILHIIVAWAALEMTRKQFKATARGD